MKTFKQVTPGKQVIGDITSSKSNRFAIIPLITIIKILFQLISNSYYTNKIQMIHIKQFYYQHNVLRVIKKFSIPYQPETS